MGEVFGRINISKSGGIVMSKVSLFLADGFEEIEGLTVVDLLRRADVELETVSVMGRKEIKGAHNITVLADVVFEEADFADTAMLVLPGGMPGTLHLENHKGLQELIRTFDENGKELAAICAAPTVFGHMGLLEGRKAVCYPSMEEGLVGADVCFEGVVTDGHITTARGMGVSIDFALRLISILCGEEKADKIARQIVYKVD